MKYNSAKGRVIPLVMLLLLIVGVSFIIQHLWIPVLVLILIECFFLWVWFDTYYVIKDEHLFYKSAFIKGSIPISVIHEIVKHKGLYSGSLKPALSMTGLVVKYNRWDDMYISPARADEFIGELQKVNPTIKVR